MTLKQRLRDATGPDRQLADEVLLAYGWERTEIGLLIAPDGRSYMPHENRPNPLASIDAACMLRDPAHPGLSIHEASFRIFDHFATNDPTIFELCRQLCLDALEGGA